MGIQLSQHRHLCLPGVWHMDSDSVDILALSQHFDEQGGLNQGGRAGGMVRMHSDGVSHMALEA